MKPQEQELSKNVLNVEKLFIDSAAELIRNFALGVAGKKLNKSLRFVLFVKSPFLFLNLLPLDIEYVVWNVVGNSRFIKLVLDVEKYLQPKEKILNIALKHAEGHLFILNVLIVKSDSE